QRTTQTCPSFFKLRCVAPGTRSFLRARQASTRWMPATQKSVAAVSGFMHRQGKKRMPTLNINGHNMSVEAANDSPLLWAIREQLQMTGTKFGCGAGLCGAC